ncbi:hypothetical protein AAKU55_005889 [Oxalobacteraceae bacterium GrIS 1.11]
MLLDRFGGNPLQEEIDALTSPQAKGLPLDDELFKDDPDRAPLLLELLHSEPSHQALLESSIRLAQDEAKHVDGPHCVCGWLFSGATLNRLRIALRQRLDVRYFPSGERIYLRYFDPRVMPRLSRLLVSTADEVFPPHSSFAQLLGPVQLWCQLDRDGQLLRHANPTPAGDAIGDHLHFDEQTAMAIDRIEAINLTVRVLASNGMPCHQSDDLRIDAQLLVAQKLGSVDVDDQVAYAWRALRYGAPFTSQIALPDLIKQAVTQGMPLDALLDQHTPSHHQIDAPAPAAPAL